jgi:hypothetical protein
LSTNLWDNDGWKFNGETPAVFGNLDAGSVSEQFHLTLRFMGDVQLNRNKINGNSCICLKPYETFTGWLTSCLIGDNILCQRETNVF